MNPETLFSANLDWASSIARAESRSLPPCFDVADLEQEARLEMWKQTQRFDPSRGVPFQAFAYRAVQGAVLMSVRRRRYRDATGEPLKSNHVDEERKPDERLLALEHERRTTGPLESTQLAILTEMVQTLQPAEAYLVRRVYFENIEINQLEQTWGMRLENRIRGAVRLLKKKRCARLI